MSNTVRGAVEKRQQQPATPAAGRADLAGEVKRILAKQTKAFEAVLPGDADPERFARLVLTAVRAAPGLLKCFDTEQGQMSLLLAAMQSAAVGLEPNTPAQDAWLLPRKNDGVDECQLMLGYRGLLKLVRRSGQVAHCQAFAVRENDEFDFYYGLGADHLKYRPGPAGARGELTHAFAVVRFLNGTSQFMVLDEEQVHKRRAMSPSWSSIKRRSYSPWVTWTDEMWRKSAVRAMTTWLELSPEVMTAIMNDERRLVLRDGGGIAAAPELQTPNSWDEGTDSPDVFMSALAAAEGDEHDGEGGPPVGEDSEQEGETVVVDTLPDSEVAEQVRAAQEDRSNTVESKARRPRESTTAVQAPSDEAKATMGRLVNLAIRKGLLNTREVTGIGRQRLEVARLAGEVVQTSFPTMAELVADAQAVETVTRTWENLPNPTGEGSPS